MSDAPYDQRLANESTAVEQCMKLGAVVLKPQNQQVVGFTAPPAPVDPAELARQAKFVAKVAR